MSLTLKTDTEVPQGLSFEELLVFLQTKTQLLMYINEGVLGWWNSLEEVPDGGYEVDEYCNGDGYHVVTAKETHPTYGYKQSFTVVSDDVVIRMCK